jgi:hypothetical protein
MSTISSHTLPEFSAAPLLVKPSVEAAAGRSAEVKKDPTCRPLGKRATLAFAYYLIVISVRGHLGLAGLWRCGETPDRAGRLYFRSAAAQRYAA